MTSKWRRCDVVTSHRRPYDVMCLLEIWPPNILNLPTPMTFTAELEKQAFEIRHYRRLLVISEKDAERFKQPLENMMNTCPWWRKGKIFSLRNRKCKIKGVGEGGEAETFLFWKLNVDPPSPTGTCCNISFVHHYSFHICLYYMIV